jgi:hypothetical protein
MPRARGMIESANTTGIPSDVVWGPDREVVMYAVVPCRPSGYRIVERRCTLEEAAAFGTFSDRDVGGLQVARVEGRVSREATKP